MDKRQDQLAALRDHARRLREMAVRNHTKLSQDLIRIATEIERRIARIEDAANE